VPRPGRAAFKSAARLEVGGIHAMSFAPRLSRDAGATCQPSSGIDSPRYAAARKLSRRRQWTVATV